MGEEGGQQGELWEENQSQSDWIGIMMMINYGVVIFYCLNVLFNDGYLILLC